MPAATKPSPPEAGSRGDSVVETERQILSELVARILDQLSVSAWLPAGILVFGILLAGSLKAKDGHVERALAALGPPFSRSVDPPSHLDLALTTAPRGWPGRGNVGNVRLGKENAGC
jgi:hypothetical protein